MVNVASSSGDIVKMEDRWHCLRVRVSCVDIYKWNYSSSNLLSSLSWFSVDDLTDGIVSRTVGIDVASSKISSFAISGMGASLTLASIAASSVGLGFISTWVGLRWWRTTSMRIRVTMETIMPPKYCHQPVRVSICTIRWCPDKLTVGAGLPLGFALRPSVNSLFRLC